MPSGGHNRKPWLQAVREGNPGKRPIKDSVVFAPSDLVEPEWSDWFDESEAARAHKLWAQLAPSLSRSAGLVGEQQAVLVDYIITWVRIDSNERGLAAEGVVVENSFGNVVKNPRTTILNQYRAHFRSLTGELGLSPRAAAGIEGDSNGGEEEDPFD